jgi:hypothetical protein
LPISGRRSFKFNGAPIRISNILMSHQYVEREHGQASPSPRNVAPLNLFDYGGQIQTEALPKTGRLCPRCRIVRMSTAGTALLAGNAAERISS